MTKLLLNLTNHPSSLWAEPQREAALEYGEVVDMPFPAVDEQSDEAYIEALAAEYENKVLAYTHEHQVTVHLMGELTFTFALLKRLQNHSINCIASTSKRIVKENIHEQKREVTFQFARFRKYE